MSEYIAEIQRQFVDVFNFEAKPRAKIPVSVPDGVYPMLIEGRVDNVKIENGLIYCCRFEGASNG